MLQERTVQDFLTATASAEPTPGGGSIAALTAASSAALISMVANLTLGKKGYEDVQERMKQVVEETAWLQEQFYELMDADCEAFNRMMEGFRMPKASDAEMKMRQEFLQLAYEEAANVPFKIGALAMKLFPLAEEVTLRGNTNAITDAGIAAMNAKTAVRSAFLNVKINFTYIKNKDFIADKFHDMIEMDKEADAWEHRIMQAVQKALV